MKFKMKIDSPAEVSVTLTVTMKVHEWVALQSQLGGNFPSWKFSAAINEMLSEMRKTIEQESEVAP